MYIDSVVSCPVMTKSHEPERVDKTIPLESGDWNPSHRLVSAMRVPCVWLSIRRKCISSVIRKVWQSYFKCTFHGCDYLMSTALCQAYTKSLLHFFVIHHLLLFIVQPSADSLSVSQPKWVSSFYDICLKPRDIQSDRLTRCSVDVV